MTCDEPVSPQARGARSRDRLGIVAAVSGSLHGDALYVPLSFGRVVDGLVRHFARVTLSIPIRTGEPLEDQDYRIRSGALALAPQPHYASTLGGLMHAPGLLRSYWRIVRDSDAVFIRGLMPCTGSLLGLCAAWRREVCHWIVGNPLALLLSHRRAGRLMDWASIAWAWHAQWAARCGRWWAGGAFLCNGAELAALYRSPRTVATVSSTISESEFFHRADTCERDPVRILFISYLRPEKGVDFLIEALPLLATRRDWRLRIVGSSDQFPAYRALLEQKARRLVVADRIEWHGHAAYGPALFTHFRESDVFVLPSLSEGTPRVLIEARANGLPVIATRVGGTPSSVEHERTGLLVPPGDPRALAAAIDRVLAEPDLRRRLIAEGMAFARLHTVERFCDLVAATLRRTAVPAGAAPQPDGGP